MKYPSRKDVESRIFIFDSVSIFVQVFLTSPFPMNVRLCLPDKKDRSGRETNYLRFPVSFSVFFFSFLVKDNDASI